MKTALLAGVAGASFPLVIAQAGYSFTIPEIVQATASGVIASLLTIIVAKLAPAAIEKFFLESKAARDHDSVERDADRKKDEREREKQREHFDAALKFLQERNHDSRKSTEQAMLLHIDRLEKAIAVSIERAVQSVYSVNHDRRRIDGATEAAKRAGDDGR